MSLFSKNGRTLFIPFALISSLCLFSAIAGEREDRELIARLGAEDASLREQAEKDIQSKGKSILPLLQEAQKSDDPEIAERAQKILTNILLGIPQDKDSPLAIFINQYKEAGEEEKMELLGDFLLRDDASFQEIRAVTLICIQSPPAESDSNDVPEWILDVYFAAINKENQSLLNDGKVAEAVELWSDVKISPFIRIKYASMLFYTDTPLDRSRFSDDTANLIEAEIALLNREPEKAKELAGDLDPEISALAATAQFDMAGSLTPLLGHSYTASTCPADKIMRLWTLAKAQNNESLQKELVARLVSEIEEFLNTPPSQKTELPAFEGPDIFSNPLLKAKLLLAMGEYQKSTELLSRLFSSKAVIEQYYLNCLAYASPLNFDLRQLGATEDSLPALLDLAASIQPISPEKKPTLPFPGLNDESTTKEFSDLPDQDRITLQRLVPLSLYAFSRGEEDKILPHIIAHIEQCEKQHKFYLSLAYINAFNVNSVHSSSFSLLEQFHHKKWFTQQDLNHFKNSILALVAKQDAQHIVSEFINTTSSEKLSDIESLRRILVLLNLIPGKEGESQDLLEKALTYIEKINVNSPEKATLFSQILAEAKHIYPPSSQKEINRIIEKRGTPYWSSTGALFNPSIVIDVSEFANKKVMDMYLSFYKQVLGTSKLFPEYGQEAKNAPPQLQEDENISYLPSLDLGSQIAEMGEYLAAHMQRKGDTQGANALRKKTRLYATSEELVRLINAQLFYYAPIPPKEYLSAISPYFSMPQEADLDTLLFYYLNITCASVQLSAQKEYLKEKLFLLETITLGFDHFLALLVKPSDMSSLSTYTALTRIMEKDSQVLEAEFSTISALWEQMRYPAYSVDEVLGFHPSLRAHTETYYQEKRAHLLALLKKWPRCQNALHSLIELSLVLDKDGENTEKYISAISVSWKRDRYILATKAFRAYHDKNFSQAEKLFRQVLEGYSDTNPLFIYMGIKLKNMATMSAQK